jgi:hypothetical protein
MAFAGFTQGSRLILTEVQGHRHVPDRQAANAKRVFESPGFEESGLAVERQSGCVVREDPEVKPGETFVMRKGDGLAQQFLAKTLPSKSGLDPERDARAMLLDLKIRPGEVEMRDDRPALGAPRTP